MGRRFIIARLMLMRATISKKGDMPASATCPVTWAMPMGPAIPGSGPPTIQVWKPFLVRVRTSQTRVTAFGDGFEGGLGFLDRAEVAGGYYDADGALGEGVADLKLAVVAAGVADADLAFGVCYGFDDGEVGRVEPGDDGYGFDDGEVGGLSEPGDYGTAADVELGFGAEVDGDFLYEFVVVADALSVYGDDLVAGPDSGLGRGGHGGDAHDGYGSDRHVVGKYEEDGEDDDGRHDVHE